MPGGVNFIPSALAKQSKRGKPLQGFFFPSFSGNELQCPVKALREYEDRTGSLRGDETSLFLAMIKPHKPAVTFSTIACRLEKVLESSGIDASLFSAHSIRGASTSAASASDMTTAEILTAADWSSQLVFETFYHRPTHDPKFGCAVLGTK